MDNIRMVLWVGLAALLWVAFQTWEMDYGEKPAQSLDRDTAATDVPALSAPDADMDMPSIPSSDLPAVPVTGDLAVDSVSETGSELEAGTRVHVVTDVLDIEIDLNGGSLVSASLSEYPVSKKAVDTKVRLLSGSPDRLYVLRSGLRNADGLAEPNHKQRFSSNRTEYVLGDGSDSIDVVLSWDDGGGVVATKTLTFRRGSYAIDVRQALANGSGAVYRAADYLQLHRRHAPPERSMFNVDSYSFTGPVTYDGDSYEKHDFDDLEEEPYRQTLEGGWIASIEHHFLAAAVPAGDKVYAYNIGALGDGYVMSAIGQAVSVAPGETAEFSSTYWVGPKTQSELVKINDGLPLTVDYGKLTILAKPMFWLLSNVHDYVRNWGWSIILVTFLIKLVFYKLTEASGRSMAKMRKLQPRLKQLQERYKDDREALSRAMMEMYKREKANPAAGCLPMLVQIPFFIAFYWVLLESVEMRQAPFALWIDDLSTRDPFFILPILMGAAMFIQQKLNPPPPDPVQAKVMSVLPLVFTVFFAFFPSGLVLYWLTNSVLSILQQWRINRAIEAEA
jgi:YidC/Oxa1 family membrane protein insertase